MNEKELKILKEITSCMDMILIDKQYIFKESWKTCNINYLIEKLFVKVQEIFLPNHTNDRKLRDLIHTINYCFFLYYRLREV